MSVTQRPALDEVAEFIKANLRVRPVPLVPEIRLFTGHPGSGLGRLFGEDEEAAAPYWAYPWAGGIVLARYLFDRPETVEGRTVLDLGAGSGLVGIAAARSGAARVFGADVDPVALSAVALNAIENGVEIVPRLGDPMRDAPPAVDLVVVGDLFYDAEVAGRLTAFLDRCRAAGIEVLVGDPYRAHLPAGRLRPVAEFAVPDFGDAQGAATTRGAVFAFR